MWVGFPAVSVGSRSSSFPSKSSLSSSLELERNNQNMQSNVIAECRFCMLTVMNVKGYENTGESHNEEIKGCSLISSEGICYTGSSLSSSSETRVQSVSPPQTTLSFSSQLNRLESVVVKCYESEGTQKYRKVTRSWCR